MAECAGTAAAAARVPILMYHSIAISAGPRFARFVVHPADFAAQMDYLAVAGYQPITAADLARRHASGDLPAKAAVLTFDDAYTDFETAVMPILQKNGFPATLCVPTAYVGRCASWLRDCNEDRRLILSWRALRDVVSAGVEVASHSHSHPQLDRIPLSVVRAEVRRSRELLEDNLSVSVEGFAYPFGYWSRSVRSSVRAAGYSYACAVGEHVPSAATDSLTLPRMTVVGGMGLDAFAGILGASSAPVARWSSEMKRWAWRAMRRHIRAIGGDPQAGRDDGDAIETWSSREHEAL